MRSYAIKITSPGGQLWTPPGFSGISLGGGGLAGGASYGSMVNGQTLPGAWDIELDSFSYDFATSVGGGSVTIWGVSLQEIAQASNLNNFNVEVWGGMAAWRGQNVLATTQAPYAGLLAKGMIFPAFGNWIGTDQYLSLTITPGQSSTGKPLFGANAAPANIVWNWQKGRPMSQALQTTLSAAFPGVTANINISPGLVLTNQNQDAGFYASLDQFANYVKQRSIAVLNQPNYYGVRVTYDASQNAINVYDSTYQPPAKKLQFQDFIGQVTWLGNAINFKCPMRSDLKVGAPVAMPAGLNPINTAQSSLLTNSKTSFQGNYQISQVRHVGHYREPSADAWVTVIDAVKLPAAS